jgi:putative copper resistance protein D
MAGFADVILRGLLLVAVAVAVGGVAWVRLALRMGPHVKPDPASAVSLRVVAGAGLAASAAQAAVALLVLRELWVVEPAALAPYLDTTFARVALLRVALGAALAVTACRLARRPGGPGPWALLAGLAGALVVSSVALSHAAARVEDRLLLAGLDGLHQLAVAGWVGGLAHLLLYAGRAAGDDEARDRAVVRRFSAFALGAMVTIALSGAALSALYVGEVAALVGTAYGIMILSKLALLLPVLALAAVNRHLVRRAAGGAAHPRLGRLVEVELGLAVTILFAAASLTSLPPATDVEADRATVAEVAARFAPALPRLTSPPVDDLIRAADPLMAPPGERQAVE